MAGASVRTARPTSWAAAAVARLEEQHRQIQERRIDALLATGQAERALADVEALIREMPYNERCAPPAHAGPLPMRTGRGRAQRLSRRRAALLDEVGIEPGAELQDLQRRILEQDPTLAAGPREPAPVPASRCTSRRGLQSYSDASENWLSSTGCWPNQRLITLVGPAGAGKTRLGLEAAAGSAASVSGRGLVRRPCRDRRPGADRRDRDVDDRTAATAGRQLARRADRSSARAGRAARAGQLRTPHAADQRRWRPRWPAATARSRSWRPAESHSGWPVSGSSVLNRLRSSGPMGRLSPRPRSSCSFGASRTPPRRGWRRCLPRRHASWRPRSVRPLTGCRLRSSSLLPGRRRTRWPRSPSRCKPTRAAFLVRPAGRRTRQLVARRPGLERAPPQRAGAPAAP